VIEAFWSDLTEFCIRMGTCILFFWKLKKSIEKEMDMKRRMYKMMNTMMMKELMALEWP